MQQAQMLADIVLAPQTRIYVGPIEDHTTGDDLQLQFAQYGPIVGVSRLGGRQVRGGEGERPNISKLLLVAYVKMYGRSESL